MAMKQYLKIIKLGSRSLLQRTGSGEEATAEDSSVSEEASEEFDLNSMDDAPKKKIRTRLAGENGVGCCHDDTAGRQRWD